MTAPTADERALLRSQIEILEAEREALMKTVGAAAVLVANIDAESLPPEAWNAADLLADAINAMPEALIGESLELVRPLVEKDLASGRRRTR
ncbi:MAG: hypothetical protein MUF30_05395 [Burkholderiales bacterium]|jgi:hypothetical protein|nr:hypothetical protein [Burkholderiales bacterium]